MRRGRQRTARLIYPRPGRSAVVTPQENDRQEAIFMISRDSVQTLIGGTAYTTDGEKIGSIGQVYLDNASGNPAWVTVKTGFFGTNESFVPLDDAELADDGVRLPYDKDRVKGA